MSYLLKLAEWWTSEEYSVKTGPNERLAPQLTALFNDIAKEHAMEPFIEEIAPRVAASLEECLKTADPLGRYSLKHEIEYAISIYRNIESLSSLNDFAVFTPFITGFRKPRTIIAGLREHEAFRAVGDWTRDASPELLVEAFAVVMATVQLDNTVAVTDTNQLSEPDPTDEQRVYLNDTSLVDLIRCRPDSVNDIIGIMKKSPGISVELVASMLDHAQQALRDGVL